MHEGSLDKERTLHEQAIGAFCIKQKPGVYSSRRVFFYDEDAMYRRHSTDKHQSVVPTALIHDIIKENYDPVYITHPGVKRICVLI